MGREQRKISIFPYGQYYGVGFERERASTYWDRTPPAASVWRTQHHLLQLNLYAPGVALYSGW